MKRAFAAGLCLSLALACSESALPPRPEPPTAPSFRALSDDLLAQLFRLSPESATALGDHSGDGKLSYPDSAGIRDALAWANEVERALGAFDPAALSKLERVERAAWLLVARDLRFALEVRRAPQRDPRFYTYPLDVAPYVAKEYAPLAERARALAAHAEAGVRVLALGAQQLEPVLPRAGLEVALSVSRGGVRFLRADLPLALAPLGDDPQRGETLAAAERLAAAAEKYAAFLETRLPASDESYALGEEALLRMLRETEGVDLTRAQVESTCRAEIERDTAALAEAARAVDPNGDVRAVVARAVGERMEPSEVIAYARARVEELRKLVVEKQLATIPSNDPLIVTESPAYMREGFAFLSAGGPLEPRAAASHYYITPPDPSRPLAKQREFVMPTATLLDVSAHEAFPGHFLHALFVRQIEPRTLRALASIPSTVTVEGWGLYAEEIAWEAGARDPRDRVAQLSEALLRGARCLSSLGLHVDGWSVEDAARTFREVAHQSPTSAHEEALRGTVDPMVLGYTLGKAGIRQLREDVRAKWEAEGRAFTPRAFHDEFLSYGGVPLPAIREAMLGEHSTTGERTR